MITELTAEQTAALVTTRDEWLRHGLATGPADRAEAERGVAEAYRAAGLEPPSVIVWLGSPLAGTIAATDFAAGVDQVGAQVGDQVRDQVRAQVWAQVWAQVGAQVRDQVGAQVYRALSGQHNAGWLSYYDYLGTHCAITDVEKLSGLMQVARNAGWWWAFQNIAILTERPTLLHRDGQGRLHHTSGPALTYPDGFSIWAWHGTRVPRSLIETQWALAQIMNEKNAEIRRCAIEKIGWDRFIQESGLTKVASCPDPGNTPYHLALYDLPEELADLYDDRARILLCVNGTEERDGTRRRFGLPVPAHHTDPLEAAADLYGGSSNLMGVRRQRAGFPVTLCEVVGRRVPRVQVARGPS